MELLYYITIYMSWKKYLSRGQQFKTNKFCSLPLTSSLNELVITSRFVVPTHLYSPVSCVLALTTVKLKITNTTYMS